MPKLPRTPAEIEVIRQHILDKALMMIDEDGFDGMTMRKLAHELGFAAKTLYNYFSSKEEIYLMVLTHGFDLLNARLSVETQGVDDPIDKLRAMCRIYVDFGINNANYYNIMFNWDVPKYSDYKESLLEPIARVEKITAFRMADLVGVVVGEISDRYGHISRDDISYLILRLWTNLHGVVSLFNSRGMQEYESDPMPVIVRLTEDASKPFLPQE